MEQMFDSDATEAGWGVPTEHPLLAAASGIEHALDDALAREPSMAPMSVRQDALRRLHRANHRLHGLVGHLVAVSGDIADEHAARSPQAWLAHETRDEPSHMRSLADLGVATRRWARLGAALLEGTVTCPQARAIAQALDQLPTDLGPVVLERAEQFLCDHAHLGVARLKVLGDGVLAHVAPEAHEEVERRRLEQQDARAADETQLSLRCRGDGTTDLRARVPDHAATRIKGVLDAITNPARRRPGAPGSAAADEATGDAEPQGPAGPPPGTHPLLGRTDTATGERLPMARLRGLAFLTLLESLPADLLPIHGGTATTLNITIDVDDLTSGLGAGTLDDGTRISAGQARRLACQAGLVPAVLGTGSHVLDLGRTARLHSQAQRRALGLTRRTCQAQGCDMPWQWSQVHHPHPWSHGGGTDLANAEILCSYHHHRAHDPRYHVGRRPDGTIQFRRRR